MLDEFSATTLNTEAKPPPPSVPKPKEAPAIEQSDAFSDEDFAKQLQAGMADLIGEFDKSVSLKQQLYKHPLTINSQP